MATSPPRKKRRLANKMPDLTGKPTEVQVGDQIFHVHEAVITESSQFSKNALKPEWCAQRTGPIDLGTESPEAFHSYTEWLYSREVGEMGEDKWSLFAQAYVLGEVLQDDSYRNAIIKKLIDFFPDSYKMKEIPINAVNTLYEGTPSNSPARKLILGFTYEWLACDAPISETKLTSEELHLDFLNDILRTLHEELVPSDLEDLIWSHAPEDFMIETKKAQ